MLFFPGLLVTSFASYPIPYRSWYDPIDLDFEIKSGPDEEVACLTLHFQGSDLGSFKGKTGITVVMWTFKPPLRSLSNQN
jgi:hypothetical protein